jgi:PPOX class probable F420-dependent enzyme
MPPPPVPLVVDEFLRRPNPAVIASLRPDGSPHTVPTWYDWEDGRALVNMDESRLRLSFMQNDPRVALTALDHEGWYRHVSLLGLVVAIEADVSLRDIDRLALRYTGEPFRIRDRRRFSAWVQIDAWHGWEGGAPWPESPTPPGSPPR